MANLDQIEQEFTFRTSRSGGAGGQHANKVETKVQLNFSIADSIGLNEGEKEVLFEKLAGKINNKGELQLQCEDKRSQIANKTLVIKRTLLLIKKALKPIKIRKKTKVSFKEKEKRLTSKKRNSEVKQLRKRIKY